MNYEILDWDSSFFNMKVARINDASLSEKDLRSVIYELCNNRVRLAYFPSANEYDPEMVSELGGSLVDVKTTFFIDLKTRGIESIYSSDIVKSYSAIMVNNNFESLAIQSGEYSRFAIDTKIPKAKFEDLYKIWIDRSLKREIADEVLAIVENDTVVGMVTLADRDGVGEIGLIAIDKTYRGKSFGEMLVRAAQKWFRSNNCKSGKVVTQKNNVPACNLYRKCGYSIVKEEFYYHFWL